MDAKGGLGVTGASLTTDQAITQTGSGRVTFGGNVDATSGLDVTGAALTTDQAITQSGSDQVEFGGNVDATSGLDVTGAPLTTNQVITQTGSGQVTFGGNVDATSGLDVTGAALTTDQAITQSGSGQVRFTGNVDATSGLDVSGGALTSSQGLNVTAGSVGVGTASPDEKLDVNGAIKLGTTSSTNAGTIRYSGSGDFEGYKSAAWVSLTHGATVFKQDGIPTATVAGDLWVDTNDGNKFYRAATAGADEIASNKWEEVTTNLDGLSGLGSNVSTFLAAPSSANLGNAVTDKTGSGALVFGTSPTLASPVLGTPQSGTLTNCTGLPVGGVSGLGSNVSTFLAVPSSANLAAAVTDKTGSGALVFGTQSNFGITRVRNTTIWHFDQLYGVARWRVSGLGSNVSTFLATPSSGNLASAVTGVQVQEHWYLVQGRHWSRLY